MAHAISQPEHIAHTALDLTIYEDWRGIDRPTTLFVLATAETAAYRALLNVPDCVAAQRTTLFGVLGDLVLSFDSTERAVKFKWTPVPTSN